MMEEILGISLEYILGGFLILLITFLVGLLINPFKKIVPEDTIIIEAPDEEPIEEPELPPIPDEEPPSPPIEPPVEEPPVEEPEEPQIEIEYKELIFPTTDKLSITRVKYPMEVPKNTPFKIQWDFWSPYPDWVDVQGVIECRDENGKCTIFKKPIRDLWYGKLSHAPKYLPYSYSGTRNFTCKEGIPKNSIWTIKFNRWNGEHYQVEDKLELNINVIEE